MIYDLWFISYCLFFDPCTGDTGRAKDEIINHNS